MRILVDEDFDGRIVRGVVRRLPGADIVRVEDLGWTGTPDPQVLERAAEQGCIVLTHDVSTMLDLAWERVAAGLPMPGVFAVSQLTPIGAAVESLVLIVECSHPGEWDGQIVHLPL